MSRRILTECSIAGNFLLAHRRILKIPLIRWDGQVDFRDSRPVTSCGSQAGARARMLDNRYSIEVCHGISICELLTWSSLVEDDAAPRIRRPLPMCHLTEYWLRCPQASVEVNE